MSNVECCRVQNPTFSKFENIQFQMNVDIMIVILALYNDSINFVLTLGSRNEIKAQTSHVLKPIQD